MHWFECATAIVGKVQWNTFVLSVTISHFEYFGTAAPNYGFNGQYSLKLLHYSTVGTAPLFHG
jgi:hypothetical protein